MAYRYLHFEGSLESNMLQQSVSQRGNTMPVNSLYKCHDVMYVRVSDITTAISSNLLKK